MGTLEMTSRASIVVACVALVIIQCCCGFRECNFNHTDPKQDARCAMWKNPSGHFLEPSRCRTHGSLRCFATGPTRQPNKDKWESAQVGKAVPVNKALWNITNDTS